MKDHTETASLHQQELLHDILDRITDGFFAVDNQWKVIYWNREAEAMLGKSKEDVLGKSLWDNFPEGKNLDFYQFCSQALQEQKPVHFESYYPPRDMWAEINVYPSQSGLSIYFKNINERKNAEKEIKLLSLIAKETINAVSLVNLDGTISWVNNAFTTITGYTLEEAIGQRHSVLLNGPKSDPITIASMKESFYNQKGFSGEVLSYSKSGKEVWFFVSAQPIYNTLGDIERFFFIQTDISEQKRLGEELAMYRQKATADIIQAQEQERALVGRELHDNVNQILTSIKLYNELCLQPDTNKEDLLRKSIDLLQLSITEIRNLSQQLAAPSLGKTNLKDLTTDLVKKIADTKQFSIRLSFDDHPGIEIPQELQLTIYRILQEHVTNILKHAQAQNVQVQLRTSPDCVVLKVLDDGRGFNMKQKQNGVGIANMRARVEHAKGSFSINSRPGIGCVLTAEIPLN